MKDVILIFVLVLILGVAAWYIYRSKKSGKKCIGCPDGATCAGKCAGCNGKCGGEE